jgi:hypothetical protein
MVATNHDISSSAIESIRTLNSLEPADELSSKAAVDFYGYGDMKSPCIQLSSSSMSLSKMIANGKSLKAALALGRDLEKETNLKSVSFELDQQDYGYGHAAPDTEPPTKRRRFQRRNSKTPAMLMQMQASLLNFDLSKLDEETHGAEESSELSTDDWNGGIEIAEELVQQLRNRRQKLMESKNR